ncbi:DUF5615 family PIN-like protein [Deinococcus marmoris]|uniref:DUF5615 domain-containing protein n=1 Tax=Deinococcus marmoris TaxID=249408 RepID=A0A1U7P0W6_9DEIO|nr:DUF5615 family PIN-like protein [Deinococcus marmoris]OLV18817.1 hypothetical protein BOO71_0004828 [Deinococcus marmoris]
MNPHGYLLDENLSPRLRLGFAEEWRVVHARELGDQPTDLALWEYARAERLVLVTKDADFTDMALLQGHPPPWVVRLHCGNLRARDMRLFLEAHWQTVEARLPECGVINVYPDRVEGLILAAGP